MPHHSGQCHCGAVTFNFQSAAKLPVTLCNCSICNMTGYKHVFIPQDDVHITGMENLTLYTFNTGEAQHFFCKTCGIKPFYIPRSHPECYSINLRCVTSGSLQPSEITAFDGQNWETNISDLRG